MAGISSKLYWLRKRFKLLPFVRYVYELNGINMGFESYQRKIEPLTDDFEVKFTLYTPLASSGGILLAQNLASTPNNSEYRLEYRVGNSLQFVFGGVETTTSFIANMAGRYKIKYIGSNYEVLLNDVSVESGTFTRGTASEPTATLTVGARHNGTNDAYGFFYAGVISDVGIEPLGASIFDAAYWPINDNSQYCADSNGGASLEIQQYDANNWEQVDV